MTLQNSADDDAATLHDRLAALSAQLTKDGLALLRAGLKPVAQPQPDVFEDLAELYAARGDRARADEYRRLIAELNARPAPP